MKQFFSKIIFFLHRFSIDVSFSAVALAFFLSELFGVEVENVFYLMLFFSVSAIYQLDHFLDFRHKKNFEPFSRLCFVFFLLSSLFIFVGALYFFFSFSMAAPQGQYVFLAGEIIAVFLYLSIIHSKPSWLKYGKECMIALIFAAGCFLPILMSHPIQAKEIIRNNPMVCLNFILLLLHNVCLFSFFHRQKDNATGQPNIFARISFVTAMKNFTSLGLMALLCILSFSPPPEVSGFYRYYMLFALIIQHMLFRVFLRNEEKNGDNLEQKEIFLTKISFIANGYFTPLTLLFFSAN